MTPSERFTLELEARRSLTSNWKLKGDLSYYAQMLSTQPNAELNINTAHGERMGVKLPYPKEMILAMADLAAQKVKNAQDYLKAQFNYTDRDLDEVVRSER